MKGRTAAAAALAVSLGLAIGAGSVARADDRGAELFQFCAQCHGDDAAGNIDVGAPAIAGMPAWAVKNQLTSFRAGYRGLNFHDIMGMRMRPMALTLRSDDDIALVSQHVSELPPVNPTPVLTGGDPVKGKTLYAPCVACHGLEGEGREQTAGSPLAHSSDWYLLRQLQNFKDGVRGGRPGDQSGAMMRAMSGTLSDEQVMKDIIAHIMTLGK